MVGTARTSQRATLADLATLHEHGYRVEPWGKVWMLLDFDGSPLMVGSQGCVSRTQWEAVAEGLRRIAEDARHARECAVLAQLRDLSATV